MKPTVDLEGLKKATLRDYAIRFLFGGIVSAGAGLWLAASMSLWWALFPKGRRPL
jgi:hypothetical protein